MWDQGGPVGFSPGSEGWDIAERMHLHLALLLAIGCWLLGCTTAADGPPLLEVSAVHPARAETGERLEIHGVGFPEGRVGTAIFTGDLFSPGRVAERARGIAARVTATSRRRLLLELDPELISAFCGRGRDARHTTFRGELEVAFSPRQPGAPPVVGRLADLELDLWPSPVRGEDRATGQEAGRAALEALGLTIATSAGRNPSVVAVLPAGRAASAGLEPGDQLLTFGGVRVTEEADFALAPGARVAAVRWRRGRLEDPLERHVDLEGLSPMPPASLGLAGTMVAVVAGALLLLLLPFGAALTWIERRAMMRLHAGGASRGTASPLRELALAVLRPALPVGIPAGLRVVSYLQLLAANAAFTYLAFERVALAAEVDLLAGLLASVTGVVAVGLVAGGWQGRPRWSLLAGLRLGTELLLANLPLFGVLALGVLVSGSSRARDLVAAQGPWPWDWLAFSSPGGALAGAAALLALTPRAGAAGRELPEIEPLSGSSRPVSGLSRSLLVVGDSAQIVVAAGLLALVLCGGHALPGVSPTVQATSPALQMAGAALLALKTWGLVAVLGLLRWLTPDLRWREVGGTMWRFVIPGSALALGLGMAWDRGLRHPPLAALAAGLGPVLLAIALLLGGLLGWRVARGLLRPWPRASVNPWL